MEEATDGRLLAATIAALLACAAMVPASAAIRVIVRPGTATPASGASVQFTATVLNSGDQSVTWMVDGVPGGAPAIGTISTSGLYTAPVGNAATVPVTVAAQATASPLATDTSPVNVKVSTLSGPVFHVATTGNDAAAGTSAAPWRTIQHAAATVPAGGTVRVHAGVYNEVVTLTHSGNPTAGFITIEAAPGEAPIVDGTGLPVGNGGQQGLFTLVNPGWVRIRGFEIRNFTSSKAAWVPLGIYAYGSGDHLELRDNHIHDIVTTVKSSAGDAFGLAVYGSASTPITNLVIDNNELDHLVTGYSESLTVNGNVVGWQVTHNRVHDDNNIGIVAIGFEKTAPTPAVDQARDGWIADNRVWNISSKGNPAYKGESSADGIYVDGGTRILIERNAIDHVDLGIELASEHSTRTSSWITARNNLLSRNNVTGLSIGGYAGSVGGTDHCTITGNTFFENDTSVSGSGDFQVQFHATNNVFEDNVLYASAQGLLVNSFVKYTTPPVAFERNLYYTLHGASGAQWMWNRKTYTTFAAFQAATGGEANGLFADPRFTSTVPATPDLHLEAASPAIDSGVTHGIAVSGTVDLDGHARVVGTAIDRGAYERQP